MDPQPLLNLDQLDEDLKSMSIDEVALNSADPVLLSKKMQNDEKSGISEDVASKDVSSNESSAFDVTDDDNFNSFTITEILRTKYTSDDENAYESFMSPEYKFITLAECAETEIRVQEEHLTHPFKYYTDYKKKQHIYMGLAKHLADYNGGEFPKKELEALGEVEYWKLLLNLTEPTKWSVFSLRKVSGIFSTFSQLTAQMFYVYVLRPRLRKDLRENGTLTNSHLSAIKEAIKRKPNEFYYAVIIPLCKTGDCTLQEAIVFSSVLENFEVEDKTYSITALQEIAECKYSGACSIFIRELLEEDLDLATCTINAIVAHFVRFMNDERTFPVMWHECLLTFLLNYKNNLTAEQKENLFKLSHIHKHDQITKIVQRKLNQGKRARRM